MRDKSEAVAAFDPEDWVDLVSENIFERVSPSELEATPNGETVSVRSS